MRFPRDLIGPNPSARAAGALIGPRIVALPPQQIVSEERGVGAVLPRGVQAGVGEVGAVGCGLRVGPDRVGKVRVDGRELGEQRNLSVPRSRDVR